MSILYEDLKPSDFIGGEHELDGNGFLISHCKHLTMDNDVYIVSMFLNRIPRVLNKNGSYMTDIGNVGYGNDQFSMSAGMTFHNDNILITDVNKGNLLIFRKDNFNFIGEITNKFEKPTCIASICDMIYVGDMGTKTIHVLDKDLNDQFVIRKAGEKYIRGTEYISCDYTNKRVLLTDREAECVHIFSLDGAHQLSITENIECPCGTTTDHYGNVLVCNVGMGVNVYDKNGNYISNFGQKYSFTSPVDIYAKGNVLHGDSEVVVLDGSIYSGWSRLQIFKY